MVIPRSPSTSERAHRADATDLSKPVTQPNHHDTTMPSGESLGEARRHVTPTKVVYARRGSRRQPLRITVDTRARYAAVSARI